ncbi:MAG TPA: MFS transporter [Candidatus Dormibacteraeota bacterium]|nr:MFS transporter [Candidatus Dormibacteraeota bacterium]
MASSVLARFSVNMQTVVLVLFALQHYRSPQLAGAVVFAATFPGPMLSPFAGALLDRRGRIGLIGLDYCVAALSMLSIGGFAAAGALPAWLLLLIAGIGSLTGPLSNAGARSLYPLIVPRHLWDRTNAVDATSFMLASIAGPALGGTLVATLGADAAMIATGAVMALAPVFLVGVHLPPPRPATEKLARAAWNGVVYVVHQPVLRTQMVAQSIFSASGGVLTVVLPILVLTRLHAGAAVVGILWATLGGGGIVGSFISGRIDSSGREMKLIVYGCSANAAMVLSLLWLNSIAAIAVVLFLGGALRSCQQVAMFSMRQRHTDPAWFGRAFAILMSVNWMGVATGSAVAGQLAAHSVDLALGLGVVLSVLGAVLFVILGRPSHEVRRAIAAQLRHGSDHARQ